MNSDLVFDNKKYISANEAASLTGYSQDYIGQLSRGKKIDAKRIGRVWYVSEESILNYKNISSDFTYTPEASISPKDSRPEIITIEQSTSRPSETFIAPNEKVFSDAKTLPDSVSDLSISFKTNRLKQYGQFLYEMLFSL